jgi:hypothetical protein
VTQPPDPFRPPNPYQAPSPFQPPPVGSYGGQGAPSASPPATSDAIGALVCGLMAWGCFPLGFVALWLGSRARRAIRESNGQLGGDSLALAGMIIGGIFGGIGVLVVLLYVAMLVFMVGFGAFGTP